MDVPFSSYSASNFAGAAFIARPHFAPATIYLKWGKVGKRRFNLAMLTSCKRESVLGGGA